VGQGILGVSVTNIDCSNSGVHKVAPEKFGWYAMKGRAETRRAGMRRPRSADTRAAEITNKETRERRIGSNG
jgi:hypothetical protein